jgi:tight adherence protein B
VSALALLFLLAQDEPPKVGSLPPEEMLVYILAGLGTVVFVATGYSLFSVGWESYEEKYLEGAERTVDDLFLTIPAQQLLWLSVFGVFFFFAVGVLLSESFFFGSILSVLGGALPSLLLQRLKKRRAWLFQEQLVEALITLSNALRSGFSMPKAFQLIAHDMPKPICQEFGIMVQEIRLGIDVEEGLRNMHTRLPSEDLDLICTSIAISNSLGGNLAEVFEKITHTIRERRRIEGRIEALTAQGKLQGLVSALLPGAIGLMISWIDPKLMEPLYSTIPGYIMIALLCIMGGLGYFVIRKIVNIEV